MQNIINYIRAKSNDQETTFKDYIIYAIARAYRYAESEGEANYLSTKFVLQMATPLKEHKTRHMGGGDPFITLNNTLSELAHKLPYEYSHLMTDAEISKFRAAAERLKEATSRHYMYIFVRQDMIPEQQAVQAAHATFVAGTKVAYAHVGGKRVDPNTTHFVLIGVANEQELLEARDLAINNGIVTHTFHEEDMDDEATAFATGIVTQEKRAVFKNYGLLKMRSE